MAWKLMSVCVGLLLLLTDHPNTKGEAAPTLQPNTLSTSTHTPETDDEYHTSAGHVIALSCDDADESQNVTWRQEGAPPLDTMVAGAEVRGTALWFLPADSSHSGIYVCERSDAEPWSVSLRVGSGVCPQRKCERYLDLKGFGRVECCDQDAIFAAVADVRITWLKDCKAVNGSGRFLNLPKVSIHDRGNYTCLLHFTLDGRSYTAASTTQAFISGADQLSKPQVILPQNEKRLVELGSCLELRCEATDGGDILLVTWTWNGSVINNNTLFTVTERALESRVVRTLLISEVRVEHLNVPFQCWAKNSLGKHSGQIILQTANQEVLHCLVGMAVACGLLVVCVYLCWRCRVELVLLYRSVSPRHKQYDGKVYDAYVSYPSGNTVSMAMTFALRVLPEVLESDYGYKLFIRGRDDLPGEAVFDVIDKALAKSRRLIIVLDGTEKDTHTHTDIHTPVCEESIPLTLRDTQTNTHTQKHTQSDTHVNPHQDRIPLKLTHTHIHAHTPHTQMDIYVESDTHTSTHTPQWQNMHTDGERGDAHTHTYTDSVSHTHTHTHTLQQQDPQEAVLNCYTPTDIKTNTDINTHTCVSQVCFERSLGEYEALVNSGLKVVIIQIGEKGSSLPPPLQLLTRSRHPLHWNTHSHKHTHSHIHTHSHKHTLSHSSSQRRFWKELRYYMPAPWTTVDENNRTGTLLH